ncbi:MAG: hypothetical protein HY074_05815 [Deltaproteobacteria bacterium]|nr:hypothetical protein [Deltaproteobacteria bacterium]
MQNEVYVKLFSLVLLAGLFAQMALAADLKVVTCWNGYSNADQKRALGECIRQAGGAQKCSTNFWEHKHAAYDVCLLEAAGPLHIVSIFKGFSQREQNANLRQCKSQEGPGTICITNAWVHGQAAYDVCLMEPGEPVVQAPAPVPVPQPQPIPAPPARHAAFGYLSNGSSCYNVDSSGRLYGSAVSDSKCHVSFSSNGSSCYNVDANGRRYGSAVSDSECHTSFISNGSSCYNVDVNGKTYGSAVSDSACHVRFLSNGSSCYNVDANGRRYGSAVSDYECHVSYSSNGSSCYNVDANGKRYGSAVADHLCNQ